ncbi:MAG: PAS domain-containing protein, partial [Methylocella sp.]
MSEQPAPILSPGYAGNLALILAFAMLTAGAVAAFYFLPDDEGTTLAILLLVLFAVAGICASFAVALGLLQFSGQSLRNDVTKLICDGNTEGLIVTGAGGNIIYANAAYLTLADARGLADARAVERLFSGSPEISEAIYRLARAARDGKGATEELRLSLPLGAAGGAGWYKIKVRPLALASARRASLWSVADVTHEREKQEKVFQELRDAIDFLDYAPAGFFSCGRNGDVSYMNATLAAWLGYDPAEAGTRSLKLTDFVASGAAALVASAAGGAGEIRTEQFDIDLKCRNGQSLPAHLLHGVAFGPDGLPGPSRTLVLSRPPGEQPALDLRAAEARFARVFNATPMAIAMLDKNGRITRSNAAFARLMPEALKQTDAAARSIFAGILVRDHGAVDAAIAAAFQSTTDIPPVDAALAGEGERSARLFFAAADEHDGSGATIYALDTTEQRALQSNFAQSQKMQAIGQLAGGVAHDFNNVLTAIIGYCDLLLANHRPTDPSFRDINQIKQNANRAASLVRQLLAFSRRQTLRPQVLQLGDVLSDLQM